ncbi:endonuclease/exonuclease/phosphatase family protein [Cryptosporangium arvum]|uniref:Metal-dependent hydrolase n=1 Tax=Cryptosporangium arvum DSM 44712 TaxID=927661 RepID=A0A010ZUL2_9ACTN|nr:endonuclease/exonuclease/phosphatase family protein [Cryptosporangium arvum]EXG80887.1 metal-dependent hydrolase [Cryptosporangium arvum DSM 44712]
MTTWLRLLDWNVRGLRDDVDALVRTVRGVAPHVVVLQEAPRVVRWRARAASLARRCGLVVVQGGASGNLVLSSLAVTVRDAGVLRLPLTRFQHPRAAVVVRGSLAGAPFTVAGVHLGLTEPERVGHVPVLLGALAGNEPVVLAGDVNETGDGPAWSALAERLTDAGAADPTPTFSTRSPRRRIDGIFVSPGVPVRDYRVLTTPDVALASDHRPVMAEIGLTR